MSWVQLAAGWEPMDRPEARALLDRQTTIEDKHHLNGLLVEGGRVTNASHRKQRELSTGRVYKELLAINAKLTQDYSREDHLRELKSACYRPLFSVKRLDGEVLAHLPFRNLLGLKGTPDDDIVYEFLVLSQWFGWNQADRDDKWPPYLRWEVERILPSHYPQGWSARQYEVTFMRGLIDDLNVAAQDRSIEQPYKPGLAEPTEEDNLDCKKILARVEIDMREFLMILRSKRPLKDCPRRTSDSLYFDGWFFHEHRLLKHLRAVRQLAVDGTPLDPQRGGQSGGQGGGRQGGQRGDHRGSRRSDRRSDRRDQRSGQHDRRYGRDSRPVQSSSTRASPEKKNKSIVRGGAPADKGSSSQEPASKEEHAPAPVPVPRSDIDELREVLANDPEFWGKSSETALPETSSSGSTLNWTRPVSASGSAPRWTSAQPLARSSPLVHPRRFQTRPEPRAPAPRNPADDSDSDSE